MTKAQLKLIKTLDNKLKEMKKLIDELSTMDGLSTDPAKKIIPLFTAAGKYNK